MPRKTFIDGDTLPASDLNNFLMNQSVMTFATSAARATAIPTPTEGMLTYLNDEDVYEAWTGSVWASPMGLTHIRSTSFASGTVFNFNNVFSAKYTNYLVIIDDVINASGLASLNYRFRNGGTDRTDAGYSYTNQFWGLGTGSLTNTSAGSQTSGFLTGTRTGSPARLVCNFYSPFRSDRFSALTIQGSGFVTNVTQLLSSFNAHGALTNDGFSLISSSGNISGKVTIFGYKE
jgi:hypothetical protein